MLLRKVLRHQKVAEELNKRGIYKTSDGKRLETVKLSELEELLKQQEVVEHA